MVGVKDRTFARKCRSGGSRASRPGRRGGTAFVIICSGPTELTHEPRPLMRISRQIPGLVIILAAPLIADAALAQIDLPPTAMTAGRDTATAPSLVAEAPLVLKANLHARMLVAQRADSTLKTYAA